MPADEAIQEYLGKVAAMSEEYRKEMESYTLEQPDVVTIYNRADITPRDLVTLRRKIGELEARVKQADQEYKCQEEIIDYLFRQFGFQCGAFTLTAAREAIGMLTRLVDGSLSITDFGEVVDGERDMFIYHLAQLVRRSY
jgi:hypothetical protein